MFEVQAYPLLSAFPALAHHVMLALLQLARQGSLAGGSLAGGR